jgi:hypothetical protein
MSTVSVRWKRRRQVSAPFFPRVFKISKQQQQQQKTRAHGVGRSQVGLSLNGRSQSGYKKTRISVHVTTRSLSYQKLETLRCQIFVITYI